MSELDESLNALGFRRTRWKKAAEADRALTQVNVSQREEMIAVETGGCEITLSRNMAATAMSEFRAQLPHQAKPVDSDIAEALNLANWDYVDTRYLKSLRPDPEWTGDCELAKGPNAMNIAVLVRYSTAPLSWVDQAHASKTTFKLQRRMAFHGLAYGISRGCHPNLVRVFPFITVSSALVAPARWEMPAEKPIPLHRTGWWWIRHLDCFQTHILTSPSDMSVRLDEVIYGPGRHQDAHLHVTEGRDEWIVAAADRRHPAPGSLEEAVERAINREPRMLSPTAVVLVRWAIKKVVIGPEGRPTSGFTRNSLLTTASALLDAWHRIEGAPNITVLPPLECIARQVRLATITRTTHG